MELRPPYSDVFVWLAVGVATLCIFSWAYLVARFRTGKAWLPANKGPQLVPWGLPAILLFVFLVLTVAPLMVPVAEWALAVSGDGADRVADMAGFSGGSLVAMGVTLCLLVYTGSAWQDLGLPLNQLANDARTALVAFGAISVPMYGLQALLAKLWKSSEHPIIEIIGENSSTSFFVVMTCSAVFIAPVVEELFFRVLIQGWFENLACLFAMPREERSQEFTNRLWWGTVFASRMHGGAHGASGQEDAGKVDSARVPPAVFQLEDVPIWPIIASALLFACAHAGYGPDPIPLFLLALVLGYLYRQTHRVWPCIFLHMLVNATSMLMLWLMVRGGAELS